jgi:hypothetical protein
MHIQAQNETNWIRHKGFGKTEESEWIEIFVRLHLLHIEEQLLKIGLQAKGPWINPAFLSSAEIQLRQSEHGADKDVALVTSWGTKP